MFACLSGIGFVYFLMCSLKIFIMFSVFMLFPDFFESGSWWPLKVFSISASVELRMPDSRDPSPNQFNLRTDCRLGELLPGRHHGADRTGNQSRVFLSK